MSIVRQTSLPPINAKLEDIVANLSVLQLCRQSLPAYYEAQIDHADPFLSGAAACGLLELGTVRIGLAPRVLALCEHEAVKARAFKFFLASYEYDLVAKIVEIRPGASASALRAAKMAAEMANDYRPLAEIESQLFLAEGTTEHLFQAGEHAERAGGWREALPWYLRAFLAQPADRNGPYKFLSTVAAANQTDLLLEACRTFQKANLYPVESTIFEAIALQQQGRSKESMGAIQRVGAKLADERLAVVSAHAKGEAFEASGQFDQAYLWFSKQNEMGRPKDIDPKGFYRSVERRQGFVFANVPPDQRSLTHFMMAGFPRSGTTLLENALAAHPDIETLEEIPSLASLTMFVEREVRAGHVSAETGAEGRERYYREIARYSRKPGARRFVDKLPLFSAHISFLEKIFPSKKYVFSIRHPYDVVLSCFKQMFNPNPAMENFRTIADAARLYDFAMTQWFGVFDLKDSERVCYIRYEDVVLNFRPTLEKALGFLGAEWNDSVLDFARRAEERATKTPSYAKVRAGLSIGVQSSWRNYAFLFKTKETQVLKRWVEHFGYDWDPAAQSPTTAAAASAG